jgi:hypothetical protein
MRMLPLAAALAMSLTWTCPAWGSDRQSRVSAEVCKLESDLDRAIIAHGSQFSTSLLADEYQHTNFVGGTTDKKAELDFFASPEFVLRKASIDSCSVHVYQDVAVATGGQQLGSSKLQDTGPERIVSVHDSVRGAKRTSADSSVAREQDRGPLVRYKVTS